MNIEKIISDFNKYVDQFDMDDPKIKRKYNHSFRVMEKCKMLAEQLNLNKNDTEIITIVGLLHDIGRFEQVKLFQTYNDLVSLDHGDLGAEILFEQDLISEMYQKRENYDEIYDAIKYHNKLTIPDNLSEHNTLLCQIIRDADKLDILYLLIIEPNMKPITEEEISLAVTNEIFAEKQVDRHNVKTKNDDFVAALAFVFDINFVESIRYLKENKIYERIYQNVNNKEKFQKYFDKIHEYIEKRLENAG